MGKEFPPELINMDWEEGAKAPFQSFPGIYIIES